MAEAEVAEATSKTADQNAQAAEDAKKMLAELQGGAGAPEGPEPSSAANGAGDKPVKTGEAERKGNTDRERHSGAQRSYRGGHSSGRGRGNMKSARDNIKSDLTSQDVSDDPVAIRKQVEFYFSDSNLPMDKFLLGKVGGSKNNAVELSIIHSFKRMRHFQPFEAIVNAMKESTLLELTDDHTAVRRKEPLPDALSEGVDPDAVKIFEDRAMPRSIYAKGFGEEVPSTQFDIEAFFNPHGPTNAIRLRRTDTKHFKGSVFVEFETEDLAKKFLELDPKPQYKGRDLQIMSKKEYCEKKVEDIKSGRIRPNSRRGGRGGRYDNRNGRDYKRKRDDEDDRDWRERREEDRKNGFRDDRRRGRDGRDSRPTEDKQELDERGIPVVKAAKETDEAAKSKRDAAKAEALAKARAVVEKESQKAKQTAADDAEATEQDQGQEDVQTSTADAVAESITADANIAGTKRPRDDGDETERDSKKVDTKTEAS